MAMISDRLSTMPAVKVGNAGKASVTGKLQGANERYRSVPAQPMELNCID